jgi:hypothetical protein
MKILTSTELFEILPGDGAIAVNRWLARGDGVAVYVNMALDSVHAGTRKFVSYGSPAAQLEAAEPPTRLPDIGGAINWAYQLEGVYRGEALPTERTGRES